MLKKQLMDIKRKIAITQRSRVFDETRFETFLVFIYQSDYQWYSMTQSSPNIPLTQLKKSISRDRSLYFTWFLQKFVSFYFILNENLKRFYFDLIILSIKN
ncbi:hypothetical protein BpHYR1_007784 [Brachionus plicatilis]|uniref:Uncharacterized protein n=1 Tax=Brachionus plicatilis TaxID=10195 RepID=A0A3M7S251_BRAPC|nr:hypothetical protein BpHYR1_007784 [Brachionus plicatilis]